MRAPTCSTCAPSSSATPAASASSESAGARGDRRTTRAGRRSTPTRRAGSRTRLELLAIVLTQAARRLEEAEALSAEVVALRASVPTGRERARPCSTGRRRCWSPAGMEEGLEVALELVRRCASRGPGRAALSDPSFVHGLSNLGCCCATTVGGARPSRCRTWRSSSCGPWPDAAAPVDVADLASGAVQPGADAARVRARRARRWRPARRPWPCARTWLRCRWRPSVRAVGQPQQPCGAAAQARSATSDAEPVARRCVDAAAPPAMQHSPHAYERKLANALATHAEMLTRCGRGHEAVEAGREAVERFADPRGGRAGRAHAVARRRPRLPRRRPGVAGRGVTRLRRRTMP